MEIRKASSADVDGVFALIEQLADTYEVDRASFDAAYADALKDPDRSVLLIAELDGRVAGYALMIVSRLLYTRVDSAQIQELIVDESLRGRGIGSRLVAAVEDICFQRGLNQLTVASSRTPAFYDRLDYRSTADFLKKVFFSHRD
ncbi:MULTISPECIES: GNAT family N-acetyltransferase [unclassified Salinibacterium]|uniref:GNAT family N-acetyltransferase n=1 Tax=unclassified Salinibacterium TaxID=2632331 RepID=UPI00143DD403|nr:MULTISPECIES: GNAT family N-acetyltransferase [unclassified Salinibacterium]